MKNYYMRANEPTKKDFYKDRYQKEAMVWVDDHGIDEAGKKYLIFSNTIFYPKGGGQKGDKGVLLLDNNTAEQLSLTTEVNIIDTRKSGEYIAHYIDKDITDDLLESQIIGNMFKVCLNWDFRYEQMRLHSIAHLHHCIIEKVLNKKIDFPSYSELMDDHGINRYAFSDLLNAETAKDVENELNRFVSESHDISIYANTDTNFPEWHRWWECYNWKIPCGGVHPLNTTEIGVVETSVKSKQGKTTIKYQIKK